VGRALISCVDVQGKINNWQAKKLTDIIFWARNKRLKFVL
jgi:hypothetical protein